jgi:hypothetical protein
MSYLREFNWYVIGTRQGFEADNLANVEEGLNSETTYKLTNEGLREYPLLHDVPLVIKGIGCLGLVKIVAVHQFALTNKTVVEFVYSCQLDEPAQLLFNDIYELETSAQQEKLIPAATVKETPKQKTPRHAE